jgi:hypothetical protein
MMAANLGVDLVNRKLCTIAIMLVFLNESCLYPSFGRILELLSFDVAEVSCDSCGES